MVYWGQGNEKCGSPRECDLPEGLQRDSLVSRATGIPAPLYQYNSFAVFSQGEREPGMALPFGCVLERAEKGRTVEHCHTHAARVNGWHFMAVSPCSIFVSPRKGKGGAAASAPGFLPPGVTKKAVFSCLGGNGFCIAMQRSDDPWKR